jgi:hypothetical protein
MNCKARGGVDYSVGDVEVEIVTSPYPPWAEPGKTSERNLAGRSGSTLKAFTFSNRDSSKDIVY